MHYVICYDIANTRRRRRVARLLETYGDRLHESAFALSLRPAQLGRMCRALPLLIDAYQDRLALHPLFRRDFSDVVHIGLSRWPATQEVTIL